MIMLVMQIMYNSDSGEVNGHKNNNNNILPHPHTNKEAQ